MLLYPIQPGLDSPLQFFFVLARGRLHVEHGGQVTRIERSCADEEIGLAAGIGAGNEIVIGTANEAVPTGCIEVAGKRFIAMVAALGGFHEDETEGKLSGPLSSQQRPVDVALVMRDVDAMHVITARQADAVAFQAVTGFPAVGIWADEEPIEPGT